MSRPGAIDGTTQKTIAPITPTEAPPTDIFTGLDLASIAIPDLAARFALPGGKSIAGEALAAADTSYGPMIRSMAIDDVLDTLLEHPDPKLGTFAGGFGGRSYPVVKDGAVEWRRAGYDGASIHLYLPNARPDVRQALEEAIRRNPKYARIELSSIGPEDLADPETRDRLKLDRPGLFWVSTDCSEVPGAGGSGYLVPGGRFGLELYYHDSRINLAGAHSTVRASMAKGDRAGAEELLSVMRGTVNALANQVLFYGKIFNANTTTSCGRSQSPGLTACIRETYEAWQCVHRGDPVELGRADRWLAFAMKAAMKEYRDVWMSPPRLDEATGLSRYTDESPGAAPEEAPDFYEGMTWSAADLTSDAAVREHGWDSTSTALITVDGEDRGRPRIQHLLPVCLNSLLHRYERDFAWFAEKTGDTAGARDWSSRSAARRRAMDAMWDEDAGLYVDLYHPPGTDRYERNGTEDLRSFMPMLAGVVEAGSKRAARMAARVRDFLRDFGLAATTRACWERLHDSNPEYVERCQWGHEDIGWPIATYETAKALLEGGFDALAYEVAYRWCYTVQALVAINGGVTIGEDGASCAITEKLDVAEGSLAGRAESVGYGNQGADGSGFRWGYEAYKLAFRMLPARLQRSLESGVPPSELLFDPKLALTRSSM
jgi:alpha,alpha-trehalase